MISSLGLAIQTVFNRPHSVHQAHASSDPLWGDLSDDSFEDLSEAKVENIQLSPLVYQAGIFIAEVY